MRDRSITLGDGRVLCCGEYGDPAGVPVFYFHGFPGSRLEAAPASTAAASRGVRLIAVDRPGYGGSDFQPGRHITDFAHDVADLADALGLGRFAAMGVSGGGPYLLACARTLAPRLSAAGVFCGLGPLDRPGSTAGMSSFSRVLLGLGRHAPWASVWAVGPLALLIEQRTGWAVDHLARALPEPDRDVLTDPELRPLFIASYREALRRGPRGAAHDLVLYTRPWGFRLDAIRLPVHLWHGELDTVVPVAMARAMERELPGCRSRYFPQDAHFSIVTRHLRSMLELLVRDFETGEPGGASGGPAPGA